MKPTRSANSTETSRRSATGAGDADGGGRTGGRLRRARLPAAGAPASGVAALAAEPGRRRVGRPARGARRRRGACRIRRRTCGRARWRAAGGTVHRREAGASGAAIARRRASANPGASRRSACGRTVTERALRTLGSSEKPARRRHEQPPMSVSVAVPPTASRSDARDQRADRASGPPRASAPSPPPGPAGRPARASSAA